MRLPDDFWAVNDEDRDQGWGGFIAAGATFVIVLIALYLAVITVGAMQ